MVVSVCMYCMDDVGIHAFVVCEAASSTVLVVSDILSRCGSQFHLVEVQATTVKASCVKEPEKAEPKGKPTTAQLVP